MYIIYIYIYIYINIYIYIHICVCPIGVTSLYRMLNYRALSKDNNHCHLQC